MIESVSGIRQANTLESLRVMVTGANGFVGQAFCTEAIRRGLHIRGATRLPCNLPAGADSIVVGAIDGETDWTEALCGSDVVIHLAARVHKVRDTAANPLPEFLQTNLHGTENLAQQAAHAGIKRFVYVSSIKVNGESTSSTGVSSTNESGELGVFTESVKPNPHDPYAISKWQAELALQRVAQKTGLGIVIVRPPLVYGPRVKGNFVSLLKAIEKGIPLPLAGTHNVRSLIYVGNLVDALIVCATHPSAAGQTYIVSDGEAVSTSVLIEKIAHSLERPNRSFYFPPGLLRAVAALSGRSDQVDKLFGSLLLSDRKIRNELGWSPPYSLEQGLRATADWYLAQRAAVGYNRATL